MNDHSLEEHIIELEKQLKFLEGRYVASLKDHVLRIVDLEIKVEDLEARLKELAA